MFWLQSIILTLYDKLETNNCCNYAYIRHYATHNLTWPNKLLSSNKCTFYCTLYLLVFKQKKRRFTIKFNNEGTKVNISVPTYNLIKAMFHLLSCLRGTSLSFEPTQFCITIKYLTRLKYGSSKRYFCYLHRFYYCTNWSHV